MLPKIRQLGVLTPFCCLGKSLKPFLPAGRNFSYLFLNKKIIFVIYLILLFILIRIQTLQKFFSIFSLIFIIRNKFSINFIIIFIIKFYIIIFHFLIDTYIHYLMDRVHRLYKFFNDRIIITIAISNCFNLFFTFIFFFIFINLLYQLSSLY